MSQQLDSHTAASRISLEFLCLTMINLRFWLSIKEAMMSSAALIFTRAQGDRKPFSAKHNQICYPRSLSTVMANRPFLQPLLPALVSCPTSVQEQSQLKRKRQSVACISCQIKRTKCSGSSPCDECASTESICRYDPSKDKRRKEALKNAQRTDEILKAIINILYQGSDDDLQNLKAMVKSFASPEASLEELLKKGILSTKEEPSVGSLRVSLPSKLISHKGTETNL
ncbi:Zn(II)2Cys6 transcription factor domain-containing protein [Aspergillus lucknowensis]|uniref:Zn(2)-C6 fungal-type domain-containing protein n=1 Tax=Aspergillus lucknowensis TaxID=176173 RepID=A0ABR4L5U2_9EURO